MQLSQLIFNGEPVGCRLFINSDVFDLDMDTVRSLEIRWEDLIRKVELKDVGSLLVSDDELKSGKYAKDISDDRELVSKLLNWLKNPKTAPETLVAKPKNYIEVCGGSLEFKLGIVIVLSNINEEAGEHRVLQTSHIVNLVFGTKTALLKACSILWEQLDKRRALEQYDGGNRVFRVRLPDGMLWRLKNEFYCSLSILNDGFTQTYQNTYNGMHYTVRLVPPHFDVDFTQWNFKPRLGSVSGGLDLALYIKELKENLKDKLYNFYPNLSLSDIIRLWGMVHECVGREECGESNSSYA